jgi:DNA polymerase III epsilon subunit-like protein
MDIRKYLIFDTETTGLPTRATYETYHHPKKLQCYDSARLVQIAYIILDEEKTPTKLYNAIVKPNNFTISPEIAKIHGITQEIAEQKGTDIKNVLTAMLAAIKSVDTIVAHNIGFDYSIILSEAYRIGFIELIEELRRKRCFCTKVQGQKQLKLQKI